MTLWPHSAESHAAGVADFIPNWLLPRWQVDALENKAVRTAQAVELEPVSAALQAAEVSALAARRSMDTRAVS